MPNPTVVMTAGLMPMIQAQLETSFDLHRLDQARLRILAGVQDPRLDIQAPIGQGRGGHG